MTLIIVLHIVISVFLVGVILLQPGKSDSGIGFGSTSQSIFGSRGAGNILTRITAVAAFIFLNTSFFLARERMHETGGSVISSPSAPAEAAPTDSKAPTATNEAPATAPANVPPKPPAEAPKK